MKCIDIGPDPSFFFSSPSLVDLLFVAHNLFVFLPYRLVLFLIS
jgi:hypothetical protein